MKIIPGFSALLLATLLLPTFLLADAPKCVTISDQRAETLPCGSNGILGLSNDRKELAPKNPFSWLAQGFLQDAPGSEERLTNGYIVALEKMHRKESKTPKYHYKEFLRPFSLSHSGTRVDRRQRNNFLDLAFNDPKPQIVTHVFRYSQNREPCAIFNTYSESSANLCDGIGYQDRTFRNGHSALTGTLANFLKRDIQSGQFTHVIFAAMGWHNDQRVSICRYNKIVQNTVIKMPNSYKFRPLVIGVTWPSSWGNNSKSQLADTFGHLASVFNKATDADEAGFLYGNIILNQVVPLANTKDLPVVVLAHSYGTRLAGRSIYSKEILKNAVAGQSPRLFLSLQAAHSAYRFMPGQGLEGHPYDRRLSPKTAVVATTSKCDAANPVAIWSKFLGGKRGLSVAKQSRGRPFFDVIDKEDGKTVKQVLDQIEKKTSDKVILVDARNFILEHNDILDLETGEFLGGVIRRFAP